MEAMDMDEETTQPFLQQIPDNLLVGDYIEINGICRGPEIIISMLSDDPDYTPDFANPLIIQMGTDGLIELKNRINGKEYKVEEFSPMGLQRNLNFGLYIYALEDCFEVKLNDKKVGSLKHVVPLEKVTHISMGGNANFTSIEFKDFYNDDDTSQNMSEDHLGGTKPAEEFHETFSRTSSGPLLVRTSIRRSNRAARIKSPPPNMLRPDLDVDPKIARDLTVQQEAVPTPGSQRRRGSHESSSSRKSLGFGSRKSLQLSESLPADHGVVGSNRDSTLGGSTHVGSYQVVDEEDRGVIFRSQVNDGGLTTEDKKKKRGSIFSRHRKSKGSSSNLSINEIETEDKKKKGLKGLFSRKTSRGSSSSKSDFRQSQSLPDVSGGNVETGYHSSTSLMNQRNYLGVGADQQPVRGPVPKTMVKQPASVIAAYMAGQKAVPEFENFQLTSPDHGRVLFEQLAPTYEARQSADPRLSTAPPVNAQARELKGPAPELADILYDSGRASFDLNTCLTDPKLQTTTMYVTPYTEASPTKSSRVSQPPPHEPAKLKLNGSAPEIAAQIENNHHSDLLIDTTLTTDHVDPNVQSPQIYSRPIPKVQTPIAPVAPVPNQVKPGKLTGTAPELAAQLNDAARRRQGPLDETLLTGIEIHKPLRPIIDKDYAETRPSTTISIQEREKPIYKAVEQEPRVVYQHKDPAPRPVSAERRYDDDGSSVDSRSAYPVEVGKTKYYHERKNSLRNYPVEKPRRRSTSRTGSTHSSISSLDSNERNMLEMKRQRSGQSQQQVDSWLNGHMNGIEDDAEIRPSHAQRPQLYASPPTSVALPQPQELSKPASKPETRTEPRELKSKFRVLLDLTAELRNEDNGATFTQFPLKAGRRAIVEGHFSESHEPAQPCTIQFSTLSGENGVKLPRLLIDIHMNGTFVVRDGQKQELDRYDSTDATVARKFKLELTAQGSFIAITSADKATLFVPDSIEAIRLDHMCLVPCSTAQLDCFTIASNLLLPLSLEYPSKGDEQTLTLQTKQTADTRTVNLDFISESRKQFKLVFNYEEDRLYVTNESGEVNKADAKPIPFVPEQIKTVRIVRKVNENKIEVFLNKESVGLHTIPTLHVHERLTSVTVSGDLALLQWYMDQ